MKLNSMLGSALAVLLLAGCVSDDQKQAKLRSEAKLSQADAEKIALGKVPNGTIKEAELENELAKENPDPKKAAKLQNKISELEAKIDQERLNHIIRMRKINPDIERMPMDRAGTGYGRFRGEYCWR